jgi:phenylalanyl-tRNA synthetase beta chain
MNILIPYSWLKEYLETEAKPQDIAKYLSLCSQSVEKIIPTSDGDYIYEIEITTNRADCLSVYGIARELGAILPRFGIKTKIKKLTNYELRITDCEKNLPLEVEITKSSLCPRFTALIFDNIKVEPSPKIVQERLQKVGIRALNNVVDISNYLMVEIGQPMHTFDYDKIKKAKMILRGTKEGEKIVTLDGQTRILPQGAIVIEDGEGRIIDLCGIMGGENSAVDENTKRVLLFIQTYDPATIRRTCQLLSFRTEAAQRFEKGVDPEGVILAMNKAIEMFKQNCQAKIASKLIDIYPNPPKPKKVKLDLELVKKIIGIEIPKKEIINILQSLGFGIWNLEFGVLNCLVPHWRYNDINIPEDLVEEIARIYGYHQLPSILPQGEIPLRPRNLLLEKEEQIKDILKFLGFTETPNYSMTSEKNLKNVEINPEDCVKIANPLTEDLVYLRPSLIPSLLEVIKKNNNYSQIKIFELANVYLPKKQNELPEETSTLAVAVNNDNFFYLKGVLEGILKEAGVENFEFNPYPFKKTFYGKIFHPLKTAEIIIKNQPVGILGEINPLILSLFEINQKVTIFEINLCQTVKFATGIKKYTPIPKYPPIIEDLAFIFPPKIEVEKVIQLIKQTSPIIWHVELIDFYQNTRTFRITYQSYERNLSDEEIKKIREKIINSVKEKFKIQLKSSTVVSI